LWHKAIDSLKSTYWNKACFG